MNGSIRQRCWRRRRTCTELRHDHLESHDTPRQRRGARCAPARRRRPAGEVGAAYLAKELLRDVYGTTVLDEARARLRSFYDHCESSDVDELERLARTVRQWEPQLHGGTSPGAATAPPKPSTSS